MWLRYKNKLINISNVCSIYKEDSFWKKSEYRIGFTFNFHHREDYPYFDFFLFSDEIIRDLCFEKIHEAIQNGDRICDL